MKGAIAGTLPEGQSAEQCLDADNRGQLERATETTIEVGNEDCTAAPEFGASDAATVNAVFGTLSSVSKVFGPDLDAALAATNGNPAGRKCQLAVGKVVGRTTSVRLRFFNSCTKSAMAAGSIVNETTFGLCFGLSPDGKRPPTAERNARNIGTSCEGVDIAVALPGECAGESAATLGTCVDQLVACDSSLAVEAAGGTTSLRPHRFVDGAAVRYCGVGPVDSHSSARLWDDELLKAIRIDFPRPPIHARNLFHMSVGMWDAWAAYDATSDGVLVTEKQAAVDVPAARDTAISFAAYRVIASRYTVSPNAVRSAADFRMRMNTLGYDPDFTATAGMSPAALGNRIGAAVLAFGATDGSNENLNYADPTYSPVNSPLIVKVAGATMNDPSRWQPLALDSIVGQNGIPIPGNIQVFVGPQWGDVASFALDLPSVLPPPPPMLHDPVSDAEFKAQAVDVILASSRLTPDDPAMIDISPAAVGNNPLGTDDGSGYALNPVTGQPYVSQLVKRGDFSRVLAEYWADGPTSETPPGHWNSIANYVVDHPSFERRFEGAGPELDALEWDVKLYLALNGALHDAAVGAWGSKRIFDSARPISMIRYMGGLGQSSEPLGPSYHADGLPLEPGLVEVITNASSASGERHAALSVFVGEIAVLAWPGDPADPLTEYSGVRWVRAKRWVPYQRSTFVTPPFAGYVSGHSTYSRSAAEVLTRLTGSPYFPDGLGEFAAPQDDFLAFEIGPSAPVTLQWASYYDAADQAGQSRIWGGIHITADDLEGRILGAAAGNAAYDRALTFYDGTAVP